MACAQEDKGFEFKLVCEAASPQCDKIADSNHQEELWVERNVVLSDSDIQEVKNHGVKIVPAAEESRLRVIFNDQGKEKLADITSKNVKKRLAIFYGGEYLVAPVIAEPITSGEIEIAGPMAMEKAEAIVAKFKKAQKE